MLVTAPHFVTTLHMCTASMVQGTEMTVVPLQSQVVLIFPSAQGLLEQAGGCILPEQCNCWHTSGEGARVTLAPGDRLQLGCKEW